MRSKIIIGTLGAICVASGILYAKTGASSEADLASFTNEGLSAQSISIMNCAKPVSGLTEYKTYTCPVGGETFDVLTYVGATPELKTMDLRPVSDFSFPAPLPICPSNGFVIDKSDYTEAELASRVSILSDPEYKEKLTQNLPSHVVGLEFLSRLPMEEAGDHFDVPYMALQSAWEAEACGSDTYPEHARVAASILTHEVRSSKTPFPLRMAYAPAVPDLARKAGLFETSIQLIEDTCRCVMVPVMHVLMSKVRRAAEAEDVNDIIVSPDDPELAEFVKSDLTEKSY